MRLRKKYAVITLIGLLVLSSCSEDYFYQDLKRFDETGWAVDEPVVFEFSSQDTSSYLDFFLDIRNTGNYPYQNIYAFIEMKFPNDRSLRDTLHFPYLASDEGKWLGKGIGGSYDNSIMYKHRKKLPLPGDYRIRVTHAMRDEILYGIERVGIHIESSSE
jgi:gliding motility-associated lipoprotein GldH